MVAISVPQVRSFTPSDRARLVRLWSRVFPDDPPRNAPDALIEAKVRLDDDLLLVLDLDGAVVGALMVGYDGFRGWLYHLAVAPEYRRRGFATLLVREAEARLQTRGCAKVNLQIRASNAEVSKFYESLGYSKEPRVSMGRALGSGESVF